MINDSMDKFRLTVEKKRAFFLHVPAHSTFPTMGFDNEQLFAASIIGFVAAVAIWIVLSPALQAILVTAFRSFTEL